MPDGSHQGPDPYPATVPLPDQQAEFLSELRAAVDLFNADEARVAAGSGRAGVTNALAVALNYFHENVGVDHTLLTPLFRLLMALKDADAGQIAPMLEPSNVNRKKPPVPVNERVQRAYVAAAVELVRRTNKSNESAARWVARAARGLRVFDTLRATTEPWQAILKWREQASSGDPAINEETKFYRIVLRDLDDPDFGLLATTQELEAAARELIDLARKYGNPKSPRGI